MSTELLREQFNLMQNEQKIKLEKLKQKKMMMNNNQLKNSTAANVIYLLFEINLKFCY